MRKGTTGGPSVFPLTRTKTHMTQAPFAQPGSESIPSTKGVCRTFLERGGGTVRVRVTPCKQRLTCRWWKDCYFPNTYNVKEHTEWQQCPRLVFFFLMASLQTPTRLCTIVSDGPSRGRGGRRPAPCGPPAGRSCPESARSRLERLEVGANF